MLLGFILGTICTPLKMIAKNGKKKRVTILGKL